MITVNQWSNLLYAEERAEFIDQIVFSWHKIKLFVFFSVYYDPVFSLLLYLRSFFPDKLTLQVTFFSKVKAARTVVLNGQASFGTLNPPYKVCESNHVTIY